MEGPTTFIITQSKKPSVLEKTFKITDSKLYTACIYIISMQYMYTYDIYVCVYMMAIASQIYIYTFILYLEMLMKFF